MIIFIYLSLCYLYKENIKIIQHIYFAMSVLLIRNPPDCKPGIVSNTEDVNKLTHSGFYILF